MPPAMYSPGTALLLPLTLSLVEAAFCRAWAEDPLSMGMSCNLTRHSSAHLPLCQRALQLGVILRVPR